MGICTVTLTAAQTVTATFNLPVIVAPSPPQSISAIAGNGTIAISFIPPISDGGASISNYTVRCNAGAVIASNISSPILLSGLTNGAAYSCTVTASNSAGDSLPSALVSAIPQGQLALSGVFSRKTHGSAGPFDLTIDLTKQISGPVTVEPRSIGGGHNIVFQFNQPVTSLGTLAVVDGQGATVSFTPTISGNEIAITLTGSLNGKRVAININGVNGVGVAAASLGFLLGDVNESRLVDINDVRTVRARSGQITSGTNFRLDINTSGVITGGDIAAVKARSGNVLQ